MSEHILDKVDRELSEIRQNLYKCFEYTDVESVMSEIGKAIDRIESVQDTLLEV